MNLWTPSMTLEDVEKEVIKEAFAFHRQNKTQTSIALGISIRTLDSKLAKYGSKKKAKPEPKKKKMDLDNPPIDIKTAQKAVTKEDTKGIFDMDDKALAL